MADFIRASDAIVTAVLSFPAVTNKTVQLFRCKKKELAGFVITPLAQTDGTVLLVSQVYDYTKGRILKGTISVLPGVDLTAGLFSSGCWCDNADPTAADANFYQVDY